jgi:hypothetical protein
MGFFSTRNNDGGSSKAESSNTIRDKDWKGIQDRAWKANPKARNGDEAARRSRLASDNRRNRESC